MNNSDSKNANSYLEGLMQQMVKNQLELNRVLYHSHFMELRDFIEEVLDKKIKVALGGQVQEHYSREQAAQKLGVSLVSLDKYRKAGVIKAKKLGRNIRIEASEINRCWKEIKSRNLKY